MGWAKYMEDNYEIISERERDRGLVEVFTKPSVISGKVIAWEGSGVKTRRNMANKDCPHNNSR